MAESFKAMKADRLEASMKAASPQNVLASKLPERPSMKTSHTVYENIPSLKGNSSDDASSKESPQDRLLGKPHQWLCLL